MGLIYENAIRPLLFRLDPDQAHDRGRSALMALASLHGLCSLLRRYNQVKAQGPVECFGLRFPNRVGLAAGMDKDGEFPRAVEALGFGHTEIGTVTPEGQPGNPQPRLFRVPEQGVLVNRMGFNNKGAAAMAARLSKTYPRGKRGIPVGINIGKAKATPLERAVEDYLQCYRVLVDQADYFTVNISSPNTPGLRDLQGAGYLRTLLHALQEENRGYARKLGHPPRPLLLKIAPDLSFRQIDAIVEILLELGFDGVIATNTTVERPAGFPSSEDGGLSGGAFLRHRSTEIINYLYRATGGKLPVVGVGGVDSAVAAGEKLDAGACLVQVYTGWVYRGPFLARDLAKALRARDAEWI